MIGGDHRTGGILDAHIALRAQRVVVSIIDHLVGKQHVVAIVNLYIALSRDLIVLVVVDHLIGL